jgi:predicted porin
MTAPVVAQADATLYGKFEMRLKSAENSDLELESDDFRVGLKGDVDLGLESTKGIFGYETEINPDDAMEGPKALTAFGDSYDAGLTTRKAFVGATGNWGTVLAGRFANPAEVVINYTANLSEDTYSDAFNPDHLGSALAYVSPTVSGLNGYVGVVMEGQGDDAEDDADGYVLGANYAMGGLNLSVAYWQINDTYASVSEAEAGADYYEIDNDPDSSTFGKVVLVQPSAESSDDIQYTAVGGSYTLGNTTLGLSYQNLDAGGSADADIVGVKLSHTIDALTLSANYHDADDMNTLTAAGYKDWNDQYSLNVVYALGSRATLDAEYVSTDSDNQKVDGDTFSVAYTLKF